MGTTLRRRGRRLRLLAALTATGLLAAPSALAEEGEPTEYPWAPGLHSDGPIPDQVFEELGDCPNPDQFDLSDPNGGPVGRLRACIKIRIKSGEFKLGSTEASIEGPIEMVVAVATRGDESLIIPAPVAERDAPWTWEEIQGGQATATDSTSGLSIAPISIPGGVIGQPALDPLLALDPVGLLTLSATPNVGEISLATDAVDFALWLVGSDKDVVLNLPLSIKLNNLLLGDDCEIGEFELNLTNGETSAVADGVVPISGSDGTIINNQWWEGGFTDPLPFPPPRNFGLAIREGARLVDNTFTVPAVGECGPLGLGRGLADLGLGSLNVVDTLVNGQAGLPGRPGTNRASFDIDTLTATYNRLGLGEAGGPANWYQESFEDWLNGAG